MNDNSPDYHNHAFDRAGKNHYGENRKGNT